MLETVRHWLNRKRLKLCIKKTRLYSSFELDFIDSRFELSNEGHEKLTHYITDYISRNWSYRKIRKQFFGTGSTLVFFKILNSDFPQVLEDVISIIDENLQERECYVWLKSERR